MKYNSIYLEDMTRIQDAVPSLEKINGSRIMITGANGLICSAVVDFLLNYNDTNNADIKIFIAARSREKSERRFAEYFNRPDIEFIEYDALKSIDWNYDIDYIIHGASPANPALFVSSPVETMLANISGMNNILEYARNKKVKRVLFISSSEIYGKKENNEPYKDGEYGYVDILNPRACYPSAKRACETLAVTYKEEYGVDTVIVRPGHIYGPTATREDTRASSQFFFDVIDGKDIIMKSAGAQIRSYCYVPDCVSAIITVIIGGKSGEAYNISNPDSIVTIRELAEQISFGSGKALRFENPSDIEQKGYNLMSNSSLDAAKLIGLGWKGLFTLSEGVDHTLKILLDQDK